jgi:hypothetical protein
LVSVGFPLFAPPVSALGFGFAVFGVAGGFPFTPSTLGVGVPGVATGDRVFGLWLGAGEPSRTVVGVPGVVLTV